MSHCFEISKDSAVLNLKTLLSSITECLTLHTALLISQSVLENNPMTPSLDASLGFEQH